MNDQLQQFARKTLKDGLSKLSEDYHVRFKQMYSHDSLSLPIQEVVDKMPAEKLDWAMEQVQNTLRKIDKKRKSAKKQAEEEKDGMDDVAWWY
jgi:hypothetical protein